jgi:hypothetical protein
MAGFDPIVNGTYIVKLIAEGETGAGTDYACETSEVTIGATAGDTSRFDALSDGCSYVAAKPTEWTLTLHYAQSFAAGTLARFLFDHDGKKFNGEINPDPAAAGAATDQPSFTISGRVVAGPIGGGAKGEHAEGEVELPLDAKPQLVETPPTLVAPTLAETGTASATSPTSTSNGGAAGAGTTAKAA